MYRKVIEFLESRKWKYQSEEDQMNILFGIQASYGTIDCYIHISQELQLFTMISFCMFEIEKEKVQDFIEFACLVNFGLFTGCFEFDQGKNQIRFRSNYFYEKESLPSDKLLHRWIMSHLLTIDHYFPAMMSILFTDISPENALKEVEQMPLLSLN